jgi:hypothetical protein
MNVCLHQTVCINNTELNISTKTEGIVGSSLWTSQQMNERNARCFNVVFVGAQ